jgi:hypothetical protein
MKSAIVALDSCITTAHQIWLLTEIQTAYYLKALAYDKL